MIIFWGLETGEFKSSYQHQFIKSCGISEKERGLGFCAPYFGDGAASPIRQSVPDSRGRYQNRFTRTRAVAVIFLGWNQPSLPRQYLDFSGTVVSSLLDGVISQHFSWLRNRTECKLRFSILYGWIAGTPALPRRSSHRTFCAAVLIVRTTSSAPCRLRVLLCRKTFVHQVLPLSSAICILSHPAASTYVR